VGSQNVFPKHPTPFSGPQSHSSPTSITPFPHISKLIGWIGDSSRMNSTKYQWNMKHLHFLFFHRFASLKGMKNLLKWIIWLHESKRADGFIIYKPLQLHSSHLLQNVSDSLQFKSVQSWFAPKECPSFYKMISFYTSWANISHSFIPAVMIKVPDEYCVPICVALVLQTCPLHDTPKMLPVLWLKLNDY
jgi:hypothetical protein